MPETPEKSFAEAVLNTTTRGGVSQDRRPEKGFAGERQHTAQSFSLHVDFRDGRAGEGVAWSHFARYRWRDTGEHESLRIIFGPTCAMEILGHNLGSLVNLVRDGKLNDPNFVSRMRGTGLVADNLNQMFKIYCQKYGLNGRDYSLNSDEFSVPPEVTDQMTLF